MNDAINDSNSDPSVSVDDLPAVGGKSGLERKPTQLRQDPGVIEGLNARIA